MRTIQENYELQLEAWQNAFESYNLLKEALNDISVNVPSNSSLLAVTNLAIPYINNNVSPKYEEITITKNGTYTPSAGFDAFNKVIVNVSNSVSGKIVITNTDETDVSNYATAQVVDSNLVTGNIKKGVNILGITGTYTGGIDGISVSGNEYKVTLNNKDFVFSGNNTIYSEQGTTTLSTSGHGTYSTDNLIAENIKKDVSILGVTGTYEGGSYGGIGSVKALLDYTKSCKYMFREADTITDLTGYLFYDDTSEVIEMSYMFNYCIKLTTIPLLNTSNVTSMYGMFYKCFALPTIPKIDTNKVYNMGEMFSYCHDLRTIPQLDASNVISLYSIFDYCESLEEIHMTGMKVSFDIHYSTKFTRDALVEILNNLATVTSSKTLTMGSTNLAKLTDEDKAIATGKGWTLA